MNMSYHTNGCTNQYHFAHDIYILSYISLEFLIIIDRAFDVPGHGNDVVDGMDYIDKLIFKLAVTKILDL